MALKPVKCLTSFAFSRSVEMETAQLPADRIGRHSSFRVSLHDLNQLARPLNTLQAEVELAVQLKPFPFSSYRVAGVAAASHMNDQYLLDNYSRCCQCLQP